MKISQIGSDKLRLVITQWWLNILGLLIIVSSIFAFLYLRMEYTLVCQDKKFNYAGACTLEKSIYNLYHSNTSLGNLKQAIVISSLSSKKNTIYTIKLLTDSGSVNLTNSSSSGRSDKDIVVNAINNYIISSLEPRYVIPYPSSWWMYVTNAIFLLLGLVLLAIKGTNIVFDRMAKTVVITYKGLTSSPEKTITFQEIEKVIVEEMCGQRGTTSYRLALSLKAQEIVPLTSTYDSAFRKKRRIAKQLNDFINPQ